MNENNKYQTFIACLIGILLVSGAIAFTHMSKGSTDFIIIFFAIIAISIFLLLREFWCWYWKINKINDNLEKIIEKLDNK